MKLFLILLTVFPLFSQAASYPDEKLTPGEYDPKIAQERVCTPGFSKISRNVAEISKKHVCAAYKTDCKGMVIDHRIPLELGGTNEEKNLWPQPIEEAKFKFIKENELHAKICKGKLTLGEAQQLILKWKLHGK